MANRWALLVAIEKCLHPELGGMAYAEADAKAWGDALVAAGVPRERQVVLTGHYATLTAVLSHLRRLKKLLKKDDELLAFWAGPGHTDGGKGYLHCWDTLPTDLQETAWPAAAFVSALEATKAGQLAFFLAASGLVDEELEVVFGRSAKSVGLLARSADDTLAATPAVKHGLWSQLVSEGLAGQARKATVADGDVTALSLQRFVEDELPRRLRKHFEGSVRQTPLLLGEQNAGMVLAKGRGPEAAGDALLDAGRLRRLVFRSETDTRVKDLTNFRKTFTVPDAASPSNRKFVRRLSTDDVRTDMTGVFEDCRERFGYKRKDLNLVVGQDGTATLRTPDFEYTLTVDLQIEEPSHLLWRREVGQFADVGFVRTPEFHQAFGATFDQLVFEFARPIDVEEFIDRIEDAPPDGVKLKTGGDGKSCEVTLAGFAGTVVVRRHAVVVRGRTTGATGLLDLFLQFLSRFGSLGESQALLPARR